MRSYLAQILMILLVDQGTDKPEESNNEQGNAGHNSNAKSTTGESPPVDRKNISSNGDDSLLGRGNLYRSNI